jgi:hypothetical protein
LLRAIDAIETTIHGSPLANPAGRRALGVLPGRDCSRRRRRLEAAQRGLTDELLADEG